MKQGLLSNKNAKPRTLQPDDSPLVHGHSRLLPPSGSPECRPGSWWQLLPHVGSPETLPAACQTCPAWPQTLHSSVNSENLDPAPYHTGNGWMLTQHYSLRCHRSLRAMMTSCCTTSVFPLDLGCIRALLDLGFIKVSSCTLALFQQDPCRALQQWAASHLHFQPPNINTTGILETNLHVGRLRTGGRSECASEWRSRCWRTAAPS